MKTYIDIETSGIFLGEQGKQDARILRISALKADGNGNITDRFFTYVACGEYLPKFVQYLTGVTKENLKGAPTTRTALKKLKAFIGEDTMVFYHADFDMKFIKHYAAKYGIKFDNPIDDLYPKIKEKFGDEVKQYSITFELCAIAEFFGISYDHDDVEIVYEIDKKLQLSKTS